MNFCEFFKNIEKDPEAITPRLTVRELLQAREHIKTCQPCHDIVYFTENEDDNSIPMSLN